MVSEISDDISEREDLFGLVNWALQTGLWNGVPVQWEQGSDFQSDLTRKIVELLFSKDPNSVDFLTMAAHLARLGTSPENRFLLEKDIDELEISHNGIMLQVGFKKSCSKFWKKHGKTILIGAAVVAGVSGVAVVALCFGPGAASAVATGLKIGIDGLMDNDGTDSTDERPSPIGCSSYPGPSPLEASDRVSHLGSETIPEIVVFSEDNVQIRDQFFSYEDVLKGRNNEQLVSTLRAQAEETFFKSNPLPSPPPSYKPWEMGQQMRDLFPTPEVSFPNLEAAKEPPVGSPNLPQSEPFFRDSVPSTREITKVPGLLETNPISTPSRNLISNIPGINNSKDEAQGHIDYLENLYPGIEINGVLNKSHGSIIDALEVLFLNYPGFSPNTANALRETWETFHEKNKDDPEAKLLQFCHSQGTIHVKNALEKSPQEIRDRVIVVAIAPAALFPKEYAADIYRFASKRDIVPHLELFWRSITDSPEDGISETTKAAWKNQELVITLEPHQDAPLFDHSFQSPTFKEAIKNAIIDYLESQKK